MLFFDLPLIEKITNKRNCFQSGSFSFNIIRKSEKRNDLNFDELDDDLLPDKLGQQVELQAEEDQG